MAAELEGYEVYGIDINVYRYELGMKMAKIYEVIEKIIEVYEILFTIRFNSESIMLPSILPLIRNPHYIPNILIIVQAPQKFSHMS